MAHNHAGYVGMPFSVLFTPYFLIKFATALHEQQARLLLQMCIRNQQVVGILGAHIDKNHGEMYLEQVSSRGWVNKLPSQTKSHTNATGYVSPGSPHPDNFTITKLHSALVNFVMADNQI